MLQTKHLPAPVVSGHLNKKNFKERNMSIFKILGKEISDNQRLEAFHLRVSPVQCLQYLQLIKIRAF